MRSNLAAAEAERDRYKGLYEGAGSGAAAAQGKANELGQRARKREDRSRPRALAQVELLNQQIAALRRQLAALEDALDAAEKRDKESQARIADLGQRLNRGAGAARAGIVALPLGLLRPLRAILGNRADIRIVGDRFVFQSEVLFDAGQAVLKPEGRTEIDKLGNALLDLGQKIPPDIAWVLRVDGHTDVRPIASPQFPSNWELSSARAIAVVQYLISRGIPPQRLVAAGFGEFQPLDPEHNEEAYRRNRRIELKLTER